MKKERTTDTKATQHKARRGAAPCSGLRDPLQHLHPFSCTWRINLLNDAMDECFVERVWEDDGFRLKIGKSVSAWLKTNGDGDPVYIEDNEIIVWTMDDREALDELIALLTKLRGSVDPCQNTQGQARREATTTPPVQTPKPVSLRFEIYFRGEPGAGLPPYSEVVTMHCESGEWGGSPVEFEEYMRCCLKQWYDGALVK